jgi:hypothetical protein
VNYHFQMVFQVYSPKIGRMVEKLILHDIIFTSKSKEYSPNLLIQIIANSTKSIEVLNEKKGFFFPLQNMSLVEIFFPTTTYYYTGATHNRFM